MCCIDRPLPSPKPTKQTNKPPPTNNRCVNVTLPFSAPKLPELPHVPSLPKLPAKLSFPKPVCANNEAMNLTAIIKTIPATLLSSSESKSLSIQCHPCPNGTVSKQPALVCTLCLPG